MRKQKQKKKIVTGAEKITQTLGMPSPALPKVAMIQLMGNRECIIEGCQGILEYGDDLIKLNIGTCVLAFRGSELTLRALNDDGAVVEGLITDLNFSS